MKDWFLKHKKTKALLIIILVNIILRFSISGIFLLIQSSQALISFFLIFTSILSVVITIYFGYLTFRIAGNLQGSLIVVLIYAFLIAIFDAINYIEVMITGAKISHGLFSFLVSRWIGIFINYLMSVVIIIIFMAIGVAIANFIRVEK